VVDDGWVKGTRDWTEGGNEKFWCRLKSSVNPRKAPGFCGVSPQKKRNFSQPKGKKLGWDIRSFFELLHTFPHYLWATPNSHGHKILRVGEICSLYKLDTLSWATPNTHGYKILQVGEIHSFFELHSFPHYLWATPNLQGYKMLWVWEIHSFFELDPFPHYLWATPNLHGYKMLLVWEIHSFFKLRTFPHYLWATPNLHG
jgi:hypothetical protein